MPTQTQTDAKAPGALMAAVLSFREQEHLRALDRIDPDVAAEEAANRVVAEFEKIRAAAQEA